MLTRAPDPAPENQQSGIFFSTSSKNPKKSSKKAFRVSPGFEPGTLYINGLLQLPEADRNPKHKSLGRCESCEDITGRGYVLPLDHETLRG